MKSKKQKGSFEESIGRLSEIVQHLESPDIDLETAMKSFEEGLQISRSLQKNLDSAQQRVAIITDSSLAGSSSDEEAPDINEDGSA